MGIVTDIIVQDNKKRIIESLQEIANFMETDITMTLSGERFDDIVVKVTPQ